ncbi:MAG: ester cyclase [Actinomycetota bacterium]|nr:ester cyclase [Actinomycetota bacterium]
MSEEANKPLMRRMVGEILNRGNLEVADEIFAPDYILHDPASPEDVRGPEGFKGFVSVFHNAFPDLHVTIEDQIAEGDNKMVTRYWASGTHRGELMGLPPSDKQGAFVGVGVTRTSEGRFVESWEHYDALGLIQQLGVVPLPGPGLLARMLVRRMKKLRARLR